VLRLIDNALPRLLAGLQQFFDDLCWLPANSVSGVGIGVNHSQCIEEVSVDGMIRIGKAPLRERYERLNAPARDQTKHANWFESTGVFARMVWPSLRAASQCPESEAFPPLPARNRVFFHLFRFQRRRRAQIATASLRFAFARLESAATIFSVSSFERAVTGEVPDGLD